MIPKPVLLCILDGWGEREEKSHNAVAMAKTPNYDNLRKKGLFSLLETSGPAVGLPAGQMGNSEVGHMTIGSGRVLMQDLPRIDEAVSSGGIADNPALLAVIRALHHSGGACHVMGLLSDGGVHSHISHMEGIAKALGKEGIKTWVHAFLDGRDVAQKSALGFIERFNRNAGAEIATVSGRYYAMDRDYRWDRVEKAYNAMVLGRGEKAAVAEEAVQKSYGSGLTDEFVIPHVIGGYEGFKPGDAIIMCNFRADRARQILTALLEDGFDKFPRGEKPALAASAGMTEYSETLAKLIPAMFPQAELVNIMPEIVSKAGLKQLRIAETEKYAHVTFFMSGGRENEYPGEDRILIPSPKVATYDLKPEMSASEVTEKLSQAIESGKYDLIIANYANTDMVGHSGNLEATIKAVEAVDAALGKITASIEKSGGALLVTADHGNAEEMIDENGHPHTSHSTGPVPFIAFGGIPEGASLANGTLADIAPTALELLGIPKPPEMTGKSLLRHGH